MFYEMVLEAYGPKLHTPLDLIARTDIRKLKYIQSIQKSKSVKRANLCNIPEILKNYGLQWHWWCENYGMNEGGLVSDITAVNTSGKCLLILKEDCLDTLLMYYDMFHDDLLSKGIYLPHLKNMLDDFANIISIRGMLTNKNLFCGPSSTCIRTLGEHLSSISL